MVILHPEVIENRTCRHEYLGGSMRILLIHRHAPDEPSSFDWIRLHSILSVTHEVRSAWWVVDSKGRLNPKLAEGVLTSQEFKSFAPELLLIDGSPDPQRPLPDQSARKVPWQLEEEFRASGGAIIYLRAVPDINSWEKNCGYAEYGFPLAKSQFGGAVYVAFPPNDSTVRINDWEFPLELLASHERVTLKEVLIARPWVLNDGASVPRLDAWPLFWTGCDVKDPVWRYEGQLENGVKKPYVIAAWAGGLAPTFLFTGDLFSDRMIGKGENEELLLLLVKGIQLLNAKRKIVRAVAEHEWDVFICHASEDKEDVARPLAEALLHRGLRVWLDESELQIGDNLLRRIDDGLIRSRYGIVILSPDFFAKHWPQRELDGLTTRELADGTLVVLPIWHNVDQAKVSAFSLPLANRFAGRTDQGIPSLADRILRRVQLPTARADFL